VFQTINCTGNLDFLQSILTNYCGVSDAPQTLKPFFYTTRQGILGKRCSVHIVESQSNTNAPTRKSGLYELDLRHQSHPLLQVLMPANCLCGTKIQKMRNEYLKFLIFYGAKALSDTFLEMFHLAILCYSGQIHSSVVPRNDLQEPFSVVKY